MQASPFPCKNGLVHATYDTEAAAGGEHQMTAGGLQLSSYSTDD